MLRISKINPYCSDHQNLLFDDLHAFKLDVYKRYYPTAQEWYVRNYIPAVYEGSKGGFVVFDDDQVIGFSFLKYTTNQKSKVCSFFVLPEYNQTGVGSELMRASLEDLSFRGNADVVLTVPQEKIVGGKDQGRFSRLLTKFDFALADIAHNRYRRSKSEFIFIRSNSTYQPKGFHWLDNQKSQTILTSLET